MSAVTSARSVVVAFEVFATSVVVPTSFSTTGFVFSPTVVVEGDPLVLFISSAETSEDVVTLAPTMVAKAAEATAKVTHCFFTLCSL